MNHQTALLIIDVQKGFDIISYWGKERNNPNAESNIAKILNLWRKNGFPLFHIQHDSTNPNSVLHETHSGHDFKDIVIPQKEEPIIRKNVNSAFIGTNLKEQLTNINCTSLVIVGLTTDHCVSTTARMASNFGYKTYVISDATATFDKKGPSNQHYPATIVHDVNLASLNEEFVTLLTTASLIEKTALVEIINYEDRYKKDFYTLNLEWISKFFEIEPHDTEQLKNPEKYILSRGGKIYFAKYNNEIIGTVALLRTSETKFELAKMAVNPKYQGLGTGKKLGMHVITEAKKMGAKSLFLESNQKLTPALTLYKRLGFQEIPKDPNSPYKRADYKAEMIL